jgi:hypothetical protein
MIWQDWTMMVGSFVFALALLPSVLSKEKPAVSSSIITGTTLLVFTVCYATMNLWLSFSTSLLTVIMWYILAIQKILIKK